MKTITIKQPWAHLICSGIKDIENRTWPTKFRGRVLVHASAKPAQSGLVVNVLNEQQWSSLTYDQRILLRSNTIPNSAIIGSVEIVDCVINHSSIWAEKTDSVLYHAEKPIYNWVLANPVLFTKPIPAKGKLSFWDFPMTEEEYFNLEKIGTPTK
jgi:hypothetical protein